MVTSIPSTFSLSMLEPRALLNRFLFSFAQVKEKILANGGRVTTLDDPKLTHILLHPDDTRRRVEHIKLSAKK